MRRSRCFAGPWLWPRVRSFHEFTKESIGRVEVVLKRVVGVQRGRMTPLKITVILMGVSRCNFSKVKRLDEVLASDSGKRVLRAKLLQRPGRRGRGTLAEGQSVVYQDGLRPGRLRLRGKCLLCAKMD